MGRVISYGEKTGYNDGDYLLLDNGSGGTKRIRADRVGIQLDPTLTDPNKAAPANAVKRTFSNTSSGGSSARGNVWVAYDIITGHVYKFINTSSIAVSLNTVRTINTYDYVEQLGNIQPGETLMFTATADASAIMVYSGGASSWTIEETTTVASLYEKTKTLDGISSDVSNLKVQTSETKTAEVLGFLKIDIDDGFVLGNTGNGSLIVSSTNRCVTNTVQSVEKESLLTTDWTLYMIYVWELRDDTWISGGWKTSDIAIQAGFSGRFVVGKLNNTDITDDDLTDINSATYLKTDTFIGKKARSANDDFISICHQGYSRKSTLGANILGGYRLAKEKGFEYGECDVKLSSDNVVVCCHNQTFTDENSGTTIVISEHTAAELKTYKYHGTTIATLDEIMCECKMNNLGLVIDHSTGGLLPYIFPVIKKYGMQSRVIFLVGWAVGNPNYAKNMYNLITGFYKKSKIMFLAGSSSLSEIKTYLSSLDSGYSRVYVSLNHAEYSVSDVTSLIGELSGDVSVAVWTIDDLETARQYLPYVTAITSNKLSSVDMFN